METLSTSEPIATPIEGGTAPTEVIKRKTTVMPDDRRKMMNTIKIQEHSIAALDTQVKTLVEENEQLRKEIDGLGKELDLQKMLRSAILGSTVDHLTALSQTLKIEMRR